jgi:wobble nucleotide-excising tRNase
VLQKIVKITRVGKFSDYSASGDMQLRRANLIFGENGRGKSTLAAIMRSLQTGDGSQVLERVTLNRVGGPEVQLILEPNKQARFKDGKWDCPPAAIEIFDTNFVYENVYVGHVVEHEQKKNLFKVVVGEKGVKLGEKVDKIDDDIRAANSKIAASKAVVAAKFEGDMTVGDFVKLAKVDDVDKKIEEQEQIIASQKSASEIAVRTALAGLTLPSIPDLSVLQKTINEVSAEAEELVAKLVDAYEADQKAKKQLDEDKKKAKDDLDLHCNHVFGEYQKELNDLLNDFGAEFQIDQGERSFVGGKPSWTYAIRINTKSVPLTSGKGKASLGNTLSVGDRNALALAFFLAKLSHDPDLKDKCVVFDDPVCSLDRFRMECTVNQILKVAATAKQVFVLCHDPNCLKKIYDRMLPANVKTLTLERHLSDRSAYLAWLHMATTGLSSGA